MATSYPAMHPSMCRDPCSGKTRQGQAVQMMAHLLFLTKLVSEKTITLEPASEKVADR
jgi:hypothetical protein